MLGDFACFCQLDFSFNINFLKKQEGPRALDRSPESWPHKMMNWPVAKDISFKDNSIFSIGGHFVQLS